jgi:signal transduction histidine kinase
MDIIQRFEGRVFHYGLIIAFIFRLIRLVQELIIDSPTFILLLGTFNLVLFAVIFLLHRKHFQIAYIIFYFQILVTSILTWNNAGGWNGGVPYLLLVVMVAIVITSHGFLQVVTLITYGLVILLFSYTTLLNSFSPLNSNYSLMSREIDFFVNTMVLVLITYYLKENFFSFRESVEKTNARLKKSSEKLMDQTGELHQQQGELNILRNNLEKIILGKVNESQKKAEILKEYAFVNSHRVRAPLARVLGLIDLIEIEGKRNSSSDSLQRIKRDAQEIDIILKKIDSIIE